MTQFLVTQRYIFASTRTYPHPMQRKDSAPGTVLSDTVNETVICSLSWKRNSSSVKLPGWHKHPYLKHRVETACVVLCKRESIGNDTLLCYKTATTILTVQGDGSLKCACEHVCACTREFIVLWLTFCLCTNITEFAGLCSYV